ncbi:hypothetical protein B0J17DRAFT_724002 [Rhizoctonia solani]|nr:hypothetical protein B0J17DRAFT_724002 [Rhizoctonia solani]
MLVPNSSGHLPELLDAASKSYMARFERYGDLKDFEQVVSNLTQTISLPHESVEGILALLTTLGCSCLSRFRVLAAPEDLDQSIGCFTRALLPCPIRDSGGASDIDLAIRYQDTAMSLIPKHHPGVIQDLQQAIDLLTSVLSLTPEGHPERPGILSTLGNTYATRFRQLGKLEDIDKAIEHQTNAISRTPEGHPSLSTRLTDLDIEKYIESYNRAAVFTPEDHQDIIPQLTGLGSAYGIRFAHFGESGDIENAIKFHTRVADLTPQDHVSAPGNFVNLGYCYRLRFERLGDPPVLNAPLNATPSPFPLTTEGHVDMPHRLNQLGKSYSVHFYLVVDTGALTRALERVEGATKSPTGHPIDKLQAAKLWAVIASEQSTSDPIRAYKHAMELVPQITWLGNIIGKRYGDIQQTHDVIAEATAAAINIHDYELALELLEQGRSIVWNQILDDFPAPELLSTARSVPVVVLNVHSSRCDALVLLPDSEEIGHIALPEFSEDKANTARSNVEKSHHHPGIRAPSRTKFTLIRPKVHANPSFEDSLAGLWKDAIKPVLDHLGYQRQETADKLPHITWCATGVLTFLPLHPSGDYGGSCDRLYDFAVSSFAPTLGSLLSAHLNSNLPLVYSRLLAVGQENTPGKNRLPATVAELDHIRERACTHPPVCYSQLDWSHVTPSAVLAAMEHHDWIHLPCHAYQDMKDPPRAVLAFLSACQTAKGDKELPDESIRLASGMLIAGYPSVVATMWAIGDGDAPLVTKKLYEELIRGRKMNHRSTAKALHAATSLLHTKVGEKEFARWVPYSHIGA